MTESNRLSSLMREITESLSTHNIAKPVGVEPTQTVLETVMLPLHQGNKMHMSISWISGLNGTLPL